MTTGTGPIGAATEAIRALSGTPVYLAVMLLNIILSGSALWFMDRVSARDWAHHDQLLMIVGECARALPQP